MGQRLQRRDRRGRHAARRSPLHAESARCALIPFDFTSSKALHDSSVMYCIFLFKFKYNIHVLVSACCSGFSFTRECSRRTRTRRSAALCSPAGSGVCPPLSRLFRIASAELITLPVLCCILVDTTTSRLCAKRCQSLFRRSPSACRRSSQVISFPYSILYCTNKCASSFVLQPLLLLLRASLLVFPASSCGCGRFAARTVRMRILYSCCICANCNCTGEFTPALHRQVSQALGFPSLVPLEPALWCAVFSSLLFYSLLTRRDETTLQYCTFVADGCLRCDDREDVPQDALRFPGADLYCYAHQLMRRLRQHVDPFVASLQQYALA